MSVGGEDERFTKVAFLTAEACPQSVAAMEQSDARPDGPLCRELEANPLEPLMTRSVEARGSVPKVLQRVIGRLVMVCG